MNAEVKEAVEQMKVVKMYKEVFDKLASRVNNSLFNYDGAEVKAAVLAMNSQHRYLQNEIVTFIFKFLEAYGKGSGDAMFEDQRNAWALQWAKKATEIT